MKFEIGTQWKTLAGNRAVCVGYKPVGGAARPLFWHADDCKTVDHDVGGYALDSRSLTGKVGEDKSPEPWKEPRIGTMWINIYSESHGSYSGRTKKEADLVSGDSRIACIEVKWKEGEGL